MKLSNTTEKKESQLEKKEIPKYQIKEMPMSVQQRQQLRQQQQKELVFKKNKGESDEIYQLSVFQSLLTNSPSPKTFAVLGTFGSIELLISCKRIWNPPLIVKDDHVFRKDEFWEEYYENLKSTLSGEKLEKAMNCLSLHRLFSKWPKEKEKRKIALRCVKEIGEWIAENWRNNLKCHLPTREFCVTVEEGYDLLNEVESVDVMFYELRHPEKATFSQLVTRTVGKTLPPYYMQRLNTLFRRRYLKEIPAEKNELTNKQGKAAFYLVKQGEKVLRDSLEVLLQSLKSEEVEEEKFFDVDELVEIEEIIQLLKSILFQ